MSKASAAKKARRKKRVSTRNDRWMPPEVHADLAAVTELDELLTRRGWEYDEEFSGDEFLTWVYPLSAAEFDDEAIEPVTRVVVTDPAAPQVILVGSTPEGEIYQFTVDELTEGLADLEAFRAGDPLPQGF